MFDAYRRPLKFAAAVVALLALTGCQMMMNAAPSRSGEINADERERDIRLAQAARSAGQQDSALGVYQKLLRAEPDASDILTAMAETYFEQGAHARALAAYDQALAKESTTGGERAQALTGRGRTLLALARSASAERDFSDALTLKPDDPVALNGRGVAADMQGRHMNAQAFYRQALAHDPGNERVRSNLGLSFALAARFDEAVAELGSLAKNTEQVPKARHNLALALGLMGRSAQARQLTNGELEASQADGNELFYKAIRGAVAPEVATGKTGAIPQK